MSEKKLWDLKVDDEFKALIPPLADDERKMLAESIIANGCEMPVIVWDSTIVDGHNRYEICHEHDVPFAIEERTFADRDAVIVWMITNQLGRRNLEPAQRIALVRKMEPYYKAEARKRLITSTGGANPRPVYARTQAEPPSENARTRETMSKLANVSYNTYKKASDVLDSSEESLKQEMLAGKKTIGKAHLELVQKQHEGETRCCDRCSLIKDIGEFLTSKNSNGLSKVCRACEQEIKDAARAAAKAKPAAAKQPETVPEPDVPMARVAPIIQANPPRPFAASVNLLPMQGNPRKKPVIVEGTKLFEGHAIHVSVCPEDKPEMFFRVHGRLEFAAHNYLDDLRRALDWFGPNMRTAENMKEVEKLLRSTYESSLEMLHDNNVEEV